MLFLSALDISSSSVFSSFIFLVFVLTIGIDPWELKFKNFPMNIQFRETQFLAKHIRYLKINKTILFHLIENIRMTILIQKAVFISSRMLTLLRGFSTCRLLVQQYYSSILKIGCNGNYLVFIWILLLKKRLKKSGIWMDNFCYKDLQIFIYDEFASEKWTFWNFLNLKNSLLLFIKNITQ